MAKAHPTTPIPPVAILHGPERFLQLALTDEIKRAIAARHGPTDPVVIDGASAVACDVLDECRSLSLMQPFKLVIVENADQLVKAADDDPHAASAAMFTKRGHSARTAREMFQDYAKKPEPAACLVLRAPTWKPGNLDKAVLGSLGIIHKCEELSLAQAAHWALRRATDHHKAALEPAAAQRLVDTVGPDLGRLDNELAKLAMVA